jgi:hypothetical protein
MTIRVGSDSPDDGEGVDKRTLVSFYIPGDNDKILPNCIELQAVDKKSVGVLILGRSGGRVNNEYLLAQERKENITLHRNLSMGLRHEQG